LRYSAPAGGRRSCARIAVFSLIVTIALGATLAAGFG
jgi:hypothetical protein